MAKWTKNTQNSSKFDHTSWPKASENHKKPWCLVQNHGGPTNVAQVEHTRPTWTLQVWWLVEATLRPGKKQKGREPGYGMIWIHSACIKTNVHHTMYSNMYMLHVDTCCNCLANKTWINRRFMAYNGLIGHSQIECGGSRLNVPLWETFPPETGSETQGCNPVRPHMTPSTCATCVKFKLLT